ncbi:MAG TPA: anti-sigma factor [Acidimicrobiales bacterium]
MISHEEAHELLGAHALDAVDGSELTDLEEHLATCPRCRSELDGLREAAGALGNSVEPPPEELWSRIADRLGDFAGEEDELPPMPELTAPRPERSPFRAPSPGRTRRSRSNTLLLGAVAVAASAVAIVLGIGLVHSQDNVTNLQQSVARAQATAQQTPAQVALHTPGHQVVNLMNSAHVELARFVIVPGGRGYLVSSRLPALQNGQTYQLWGIAGTTPISLGLLGATPHGSTFTIAGAPLTAKLALTAEPSGGTVAPTGTIVASGTV